MAGKRWMSDDLVGDVVEVCRFLVPHRVEWFHVEITRETVEAILGGRREPDLAAPDARRDLTAPVWTAGDVAEGRPVRDPARAFAAKVIFVVADLRAGRTEQVRPWEGMAVAKSLGLEPSVHRPFEGAIEPSFRESTDTPVGFAFPWRPSPVRSAGRLGMATAHAPLTTIDPDDVPVACSLWTPQGRLEARRLGTRWLRPVLLPGSWHPADVAGFRAAASSGRAWRDNPFLPRTGRCSPTFDLGDLAASRVIARGDERRVEVARDACLSRAGRLLVVDGVVHKVTEAPRAGLGTAFVGGAEMTGPMWAMGDLHSTDSMDTLGHLEPPGASWCNAQVFPDRDGSFERGRDLLGLADWVGVAGAIGAKQGDPWHGDGPWPAGVGDLVHLRDPAAAPDMPYCLSTAARCASGISLVMLRYLQRRDRDDREALRYDLSDLVALGGLGRLDEAALERFEELCVRVLSHGPSSRIPWDGMWTYVGAIGSYVASHELGLRHIDEDVAGLRL